VDAPGAKTIKYVHRRMEAVGTEGEMIFLKIIVYWFGAIILFFGGLCANAMRAEKKSRQ
jgi:hypothetical protein